MAYSFEGKVVDGQLVGQALGSAGGLRKIQDFSPFFDDTFVVLCGDALIDLDLTKAIRWHWQKNALATVITKSVDPAEVSSYGVVVTDSNHRIVKFQEKPPQHLALSNQINTGIYIFEPEVLDYIPSGQVFDIGGDLFPKLVADSAPFYALPMDFQWVDIGRVPDYWQAIQDVLVGKVKNVPIPGERIYPDLYTGLNVSANWDKVHIKGPVYIGGMTRIDDGAVIVGPTMIGPNCHVCSGAVIERSVIFEYSRLMDVHLVDKLVFGRYCVNKTGESIDLQSAALDWLITDTRQTPQRQPMPHAPKVQL
jgi:mannose-1-phosphate guanylyltransferase